MSPLVLDFLERIFVLWTECDRHPNSKTCSQSILADTYVLNWLVCRMQIIIFKQHSDEA
jgi:hypothetical protein